jgi:hypothetical protein
VLRKPIPSENLIFGKNARSDPVLATDRELRRKIPAETHWSLKNPVNVPENRAMGWSKYCIPPASLIRIEE